MTRAKPNGSGRAAFCTDDWAGDWPAEFAYANIDSALWGSMIDVAVKENRGLVVLPVSWSTHEVAPGRFDFSSGSLGLRRLFDLARARGVSVCLRIGGSDTVPIDVPERLRARRSLYAEDPRGALVRVRGDATRFVPSAASTEGLRERMAFLDAFGAVAAEAVAAGLRVVVDCGGALRALSGLGPFDADYHPASRALFWTFLEGRYGDIRELNDEYGASHATFSAVSPPTEFAPRAPGDLPAHFDWAAYQEFYRLWGAVKLKEAFLAKLGGAKGAACSGVTWACVVPSAAVPISTEELRRFFDYVAVDGAKSARPHGVKAKAARVVFAMPREYVRLEWMAARGGAAAEGEDAPDAATMRWDEFGFLDDVPAATREIRAGWTAALAACRATWVELEPSVEAVRRFEASLVVVPTFDFISIGTWRVIETLVRDGRAVAVGPRVPWLSAALKPFGDFRAALKRRVQSNAAVDEYRLGRGRLIVITADGAGEAGRNALRRALRAILPKLDEGEEQASV